MPYGATALFAAGGTGEMFSLEARRARGCRPTAVETCRGRVPILAGVGGPTRRRSPSRASRSGSGPAGLLLLPHYLTEAPQEGLAAHVEAGVPRGADRRGGLQPGVCRLSADTLARLAERCANLVASRTGSARSS
jgi:5-dehydro-4-deoxyglucarate dehydratase